MNNTSEYIDAMPLTDIEKAALPKRHPRGSHRAGW
jgi:membrane glycosyltransferase